MGDVSALETGNVVPWQDLGRIAQCWSQESARKKQKTTTSDHLLLPLRDSCKNGPQSQPDDRTHHDEYVDDVGHHLQYDVAPGTEAAWQGVWCREITNERSQLETLD